MCSESVAFNALTIIPFAQQVAGGGYAILSLCFTISTLAKCAFTKCQIAAKEHALQSKPSDPGIQGEVDIAKKQYSKLKTKFVVDLNSVLDGMIRVVPIIGTGYSFYHLNRILNSE